MPCKKTIMKFSTDKTVFGFDDVDPEILALKAKILANKASAKGK